MAMAAAVIAAASARSTATRCCGVRLAAAGRASKSFTLDQAKALLTAAERTRWYAYVQYGSSS